MAFFKSSRNDDDYDDEEMLGSNSISDEDDEDIFTDYDDDDYEDDSLYPEEESEEKDSRRFILPIAIISIAAIAAGSIIWFGFLRNDDDSNQVGSDSSTSQSADPSGEFDYGGATEFDNAGGVTVAETVGVKHSGSQNGSRDNGTSVILGFNYAYYVERNGEKALKFFNPSNLEYDAEYIQQHIDEVPTGTKYNLEITPIVIGKDYDVRLYIQLPGTSPVVYDQKYTIAKDSSGKYYFEQFTSEEVKSE